MRVLLWHVHGSWTTSFVQGRHDYLLPVTPERDADGLGRARTWDWPAAAQELPPESLDGAGIDVVILQRPKEVALLKEWTGLRAGMDVPAIYVEHNTPRGDVPLTEHPMADRDDIPIAHVTHTNALLWNNGRARATVIEHGIIDPGARWTGELRSAAVVVNEPVRRGRITGTDLLPGLAEAAPIDVFGMGLDNLHQQYGCPTDRVRLVPDLPQQQLHTEIARRAVYLHPIRWTSLGLSLLEAMQLGMPIVALACTDVPRAVPADAGCVSNDPVELRAAIRRFVNEPEMARSAGRAARKAALRRYGLARFLADWDRLLVEVAR